MTATRHVLHSQMCWGVNLELVSQLVNQLVSSELSPEERTFREILTALCSSLRGRCSQVGVGVFSQVTGQEEVNSSCTRGVLD